MSRLGRAGIVFVAATGLTLAACSTSAIGDDEVRGSASFEPVTSVGPGELAAVVRTSGALGLDLLAQGDRSKNGVFSPVSFSIAFSMLAQGATGTGAAELERMLGASAGDAGKVANYALVTFGDFDGDISTFDPEVLPAEPLLHVANRVVIDDDFEPKSDYLDSLARNFNVGLGVADLGSEGSKDLLDKWVRFHTAGLIEHSAIAPSNDLVLVLQNAVLFAAQWERQFPLAATAQKNFHPLDGTAFEVPMMSQILPVQYLRLDGWQLIALPYSAGFTAYFVLPPSGTDPLALPAEMGDVIADLSGAMARQGENKSVAITIPRFEIESDIELTEALRNLGYSAIFDPTTRPLDGIADAELFVGQAVQQAVIKVNEAGTVAAAVTEIGVGTTAAPVAEEVFQADRPFLMLIEADRTGWDLFQAVVYAPK